MWIVAPAIGLAVMIGVLVAPIPTWLKFTIMAVAFGVATVLIEHDRPGGGPPCCGG